MSACTAERRPGMNSIYPMGVEADPSGMKTRELMEKTDRHIVDCRLNPWSWRVVWQKSTLVRLYGKRYHPAGKFLGNVAHPANERSPGPRATRIAAPRIGIKGISDLLDDGLDLILVDHYLNYEDSHVSIILCLLEAQRPDIRILVPELSPPPATYTYRFPPGTKVMARIHGGTSVPGIVLECRWSGEGNYDWTRLRIAAWSELDQQWRIADYDRPVQSYRLRHRYDHIVALDGPHAEDE